jgi:hypothetical protein
VRAITLHILVVVLIAVFAIGAPIPAKASCLGTSDCSMAGRSDGSCDQKSGPCKVAQNCASLLQKMPVHASHRLVPDASQVQYGLVANDKIVSEFVPPETTPPRI